MIRTVDEGFSYLESFTNFERDPGRTRAWRLERMEELCRREEMPQNRFRSVHIAGSKGKGSTATFLAALLEAAGEPTGLYTSPHIENYRERITRSSVYLPEERYLLGLRHLQELVSVLEAEGRSGQELPTTFELLTLLAFHLFQEFPWAVLETGLGGRLDATNVVTPEATVITPIELEHTEYLGDTIAQIAGEKAGILKRGVPLFTAPLKDEAETVVARRARELGVPHYRYRDTVEEREIRVTPQGTVVRGRLRGAELEFALRLLGERQARNALLAIAVATHLFPEVSLEKAVKALEQVRLPGRMELFPGTPPVLVDGAHTPDSVSSLRETAEKIFPTPWTLIFGSVRGKRHREMADKLIPVAGNVIITRPGSFRPSDLAELAAPFLEAGIPTQIVEDPEEALRRALEKPTKCLVVTGSFYLAGVIRPALRRHLDGASPSSV